MSAPCDCPLCGRVPARVVRRHAGFAIVRCGVCGLQVTWPRPDAALLQAFYARDDYYAAHAMDDAAAAGWKARAQGLLERVPEAVTRLLDFGAGQGHGVAAWRELGLDAEGVEPTANARARALATHGVRLHATLDELTSAAFDLVTAIHSLEHVADPLATLRALRARVRPGGYVLLEVPHARTVELWTRGGRERVLHLPAHLYHFEPETLARLVERAGLEVGEVWLVNPVFLERLFAWRARRGTQVTAPAHAATAAALRPATPARRGLRRVWAARLLPALRRRLPGYKFQLLARRPL